MEFMFRFCLQTKRLPKPYHGQGCLDTKASDFVQPLKFHPTYSKDSCRRDCYNKFLVVDSNCGCKTMYMNGKQKKSNFLY